MSTTACISPTCGQQAGVPSSFSGQPQGTIYSASPATSLGPYSQSKFIEQMKSKYGKTVYVNCITIKYNLRVQMNNKVAK